MVPVGARYEEMIFLIMELKDFIKTTIRDISDAVTELNDEMGDKGLIVNPIPNNYSEGMIYTEDNRWVQKIEFNLSVTTSDKTEAGGGLKINIIKAGISNAKNDESTSSLRFHVTVALPSGSR